MKRRLLSTSLCLLLTIPAAAQNRGDVLRAAAQQRQAGDLAAARQVLQGWLRQQPQDALVALTLGDVIAQEGDVEGAIDVWTSMLKRVSPQPEHVLNVSRRLRRLGRSTAAVEVLVKGRRRLADESLFTWELGELYLELGDASRAVAAHLALLRREPHRLMQVQALVDLLARDDAARSAALASGRARRYAEALRRQLGPGSGGLPRLLLAHALLVTGEPGEGLQILRHLATGDASAPPEPVGGALFQFAVRSEQLGYDDIAVEAYRLLTQVTGDRSFAATSLQRSARLREERGQIDGAIDLWRQLAQTTARPVDAADAEWQIARLLIQHRDDAEAALPILLRLLETPGLGQDLRLRTLTLLAQGHRLRDDIDAARTTLSQLAALPPGAAEGLFGLTELEVLAGDLEAARTHADSLSSQFPEAALANDALQWLWLMDAYTDAPEALELFARARLRLRQHRWPEAAALRRRLQDDGFTDLAHMLRREDGRRRQARQPRLAEALFDTILADGTTGARLRFATTLDDARLLAAGGDLDAAILALETLLLQLPDDPRVPIALDDLQRWRRQREEG